MIWVAHPWRRDSGRVAWWSAGLLVSLAASVHAALFTPASAVQYALQHNPLLGAARARSAGAHAEVQLARAQRRPELTLGDVYTVSNDPLVGLTEKLETRSATTADFAPARLNDPGTTHWNTIGLRATLPLYMGGLRRDRLRAARYAQTAAAAHLERARQQMAAQALTAYATVEWARASVGITQQAVHMSARHVRTTERLRREGQIVASDALTAEVAAAQAQMAQTQAQAALHTARAQFRWVLGLPPGARFHLATMPLPAIPTRAQPLVQAALSQRPDLAALTAAARAAQARGVAARASRRPVIALTAAQDWYDGYPGLQHPAWTLMASIQGTLYDGGRAAARRTRAEDQARALRRQRAALAATVAEQIDEAWRALRVSRRQLRSARQMAHTAAAAVRQVRVRYGQGRTVLFDLLQSEHNLVLARMQAAQARYDWRRAGIALHQAEGLGPP